ncbi:MAG: hypothetical protein D8M58_08300 [Calditrichaeota bacterium]|nr:MAG: hypothetical protein DWQ03_18190 [Calditrichota bacterium]MBL1205383.1 hypothetical protein [Calditrichota bacterium]NOG45212.1 hypothetical protein [Calditrichota bacterium]
MVDNTFYIQLFRFYSKCLTFPYDELRLELQHIFRQLEINNQNELDEQLAAHTLDVLNFFQGEDVSALQAEFTRMFTHEEGDAPLVSLLFTDYGNVEKAEIILDDMYESLVDISFDESPASISNLLEYYSFLAETEEVLDALENLSLIIEPFGKKLYAESTLNFYKEIAKALSELASVFTDEEDTDEILD